MKKCILLMLVAMGFCQVFGGEIGLPSERIALPVVQGEYLVCVWDDSAGQWLQSHVTYDHSGVYGFQVPSWGKWYWIGLWDIDNGEYVFGKWIGHFKTQ